MKLITNSHLTYLYSTASGLVPGVGYGCNERSEQPSSVKVLVMCLLSTLNEAWAPIPRLNRLSAKPGEEEQPALPSTLARLLKPLIQQLCRHSTCTGVL
ncbi:hypothetical protein SRHO_G00150350 [Serrasalmus rhombeus]